MKLKVVSWNIAGGNRVRSNTQFDYAGEDAKYFANEISKVNPDVILLQEVHFSDKDSTSVGINKLLSNNYEIKETAWSPSHISKDKFLGNATLSKLRISNYATRVFQYPEFELFFKDGRKAVRHDKGVEVCQLDGFCVANTQLLPIGIFGYSYANGVGLEFSRKIESGLRTFLKKPVLLCGDFSGDFEGNLEGVFSVLIKEFSFEDALKSFDTRSSLEKDGPEFKTDYMFYSPEFTLIDSGVIKTETDHYLCFAEFEI